VDALPENYFALSHLPGSINIPFEKAHELAERTLPDKKAEIVVYCMDAT
jgi:rhodanese-related sulfurtransferase